jgi:23S rRNA (cytosine1962-C5)-methyltransferase
MPVPEVVVRRTAVDPILRGHPWVWQDAIEFTEASSAGTEVALVSQDGRRLGRGIFDPDSPIAVRVWTVVAETSRAPRAQSETAIDADLARTRLHRAASLRRSLFATEETTAYRIANGEGDRVPGIVVDRYAHVAIARADGAAAEAVLWRFASVLYDTLLTDGVRSIGLRTSARGEEVRVERLAGDAPPETVEALEHGVPFVVDLARGQKTGAFLDQRENRRRVFSLAKDKDVLNLFSYAGGFSLHAALGGARSVTSVDIAAGAHATAQASFRAAGLDPAQYTFVTADVFAFLDQARGRGTRWDLIVSDPPSFAPSERTVARALASYRTLHKACAQVLRPGGVLCAASCSSHVDATLFASTLDDAALGRSDLALLELLGQPADHPTIAAWPEGRYLKFGVLG